MNLKQELTVTLLLILALALSVCGCFLIDHTTLKLILVIFGMLTARFAERIVDKYED